LEEQEVIGRLIQLKIYEIHRRKLEYTIIELYTENNKVDDVGGVKGRLVDGLVDRLVDGLVESQKQIVRLIAKNEKISKKQMAESIGISTTAIDKNIDKLKTKNIIKRIGSDRDGSWQIIKPKE
jgi:ATP-dependent DNA helicase RecG